MDERDRTGPADRSWLMLSEVDWDSTIVGGSASLIDAIVAAPELDTSRVTPPGSLRHDADGVNVVSPVDLLGWRGLRSRSLRQHLGEEPGALDPRRRCGRDGAEDLRNLIDEINRSESVGKTNARCGVAQRVIETVSKVMVCLRRPIGARPRRSSRDRMRRPED